LCFLQLIIVVQIEAYKKADWQPVPGTYVKTTPLSRRGIEMIAEVITGDGQGMAQNP
jgi:hypothetical protein